MEIIAFPGERGEQQQLVDSCCLWPHDMAIPSPAPAAASPPILAESLQNPSLAPAPALFGKSFWSMNSDDGFTGGATAHAMDGDEQMCEPRRLKDSSWECADSIAPAPGNVYKARALPLSPSFSPSRVDLDMGPPTQIMFLIIEGDDDVSVLNDDPDDDDDDILPQPTYDVLLNLFQDIYKDEYDAAAERMSQDEECDEDLEVHGAGAA